MQVLSVASELYPLVKTGGLADVTGALPAALAAEGTTVRTLLPGYPAVLAALADTASVTELGPLLGGAARLLAGRAAGLDLLALDAPHLYSRAGSPYADAQGREWPDNAQRFAALSQAAARIGRGAVPGYAPAVVHAHDWQAGLALAYLALSPGRPRTVMTVHNIAFPGIFPATLLATLGLPPQAFTIDGVEYYGQISFLKAGLQFADRITTVSPTYAREILEPAAGMGFDGLLRARAGRLSGILNGIDTGTWDPARDPHLAARFDAGDPTPRAANKRALQRRLGLDADPGRLLFGVVSRLTGQKGLDLLAAGLPALLDGGAQLAVLGAGDAALEAAFRAAEAVNPGRVGCLIGYDEGLAHLLQGGVDALLVPSRFEPCGLTQLCALRYGAVPVVARVGGLADTVIDASAATGNGLQFAPVELAALEQAIRRAAALFADGAAWRRLQSNGMATDVSWAGPARRYAALYRDLAA